MQSALSSIRVVIATLLICVAGYASAIWAVGRVFAPDTAEASLIKRADGTIVGSRLIGQNFTEAKYFWPRPSNAGKTGYDGTSAAGSNKSPTSEDLTTRAKEVVERYGATAEKPLPPELAAASGGGLDPHISERGALYQVARVAEARGMSASQVEAMVRERSYAPGGFLTPDKIVNVLELNLALDSLSAQ
ncbi:MAG: potassium-transporting ATPase subunit C [Rhodospirillaceae bacterium]